MNLCDWCGAPIAENAELCAPCLQAQAHVANEQLLPVTPKQTKQELIGERIKNGFILVAKCAAIGILSVVMFVTALLGTCSALVMIFNISNLGFFYYVILTAIWIGITFGLFKLTQRMIKTPQQPTNIDSISASGVRPQQISSLHESSSIEDSESNPSDEVEGDDDELKT